MAADLGGAQAFGIDLECNALQLGREIGAPVLFACASGEALPFSTESFDFIFSRVALPYMNVSKAVGEMARVLEPGGHIWMTLHPFDIPWKWALSHPKKTIFEIYRQLNTGFLHYTGRQFRYPVRRSHIESYQTERGMRLVLERAGFTDIRFTRSQHFLCTAQKRYATLSPSC